MFIYIFKGVVYRLSMYIFIISQQFNQFVCLKHFDMVTPIYLRRQKYFCLVPSSAHQVNDRHRRANNIYSHDQSLVTRSEVFHCRQKMISPYTSGFWHFSLATISTTGSQQLLPHQHPGPHFELTLLKNLKNDVWRKNGKYYCKHASTWMPARRSHVGQIGSAERLAGHYQRT